MGKVIDFENHFIKRYQVTVRQMLVMRPYIKWKIAQFRRQTAERDKHPKVSPDEKTTIQ